MKNRAIEFRSISPVSAKKQNGYCVLYHFQIQSIAVLIIPDKWSAVSHTTWSATGAGMKETSENWGRFCLHLWQNSSGRRNHVCG